MHFNDDMKRRAGLLVWAFALLSAGWMAVQAGNRPPPPTREQRVEAGFDALRQRPRQAPLALLGDSITAGHIWGGHPTCLAPINLAVSGVVSSDLLEGLTLLEATGARQVLVMVGINDLRYGIAPEQLLDNYRALLDRLRLAGVTPVLQSTLRVTPMHEHHPILNRQVAQVNAQLQAWARERVGNTSMSRRYCDCATTVPTACISLPAATGPGSGCCSRSCVLPQSKPASRTSHQARMSICTSRPAKRSQTNRLLVLVRCISDWNSRAPSSA